MLVAPWAAEISAAPAPDWCDAEKEIPKRCSVELMTNGCCSVLFIVYGISCEESVKTFIFFPYSLVKISKPFLRCKPIFILEDENYENIDSFGTSLLYRFMQSFVGITHSRFTIIYNICLFKISRSWIC